MMIARVINNPEMVKELGISEAQVTALKNKINADDLEMREFDMTPLL